jgi:diketogulonate reductase-like aldo/keto reductase
MPAVGLGTWKIANDQVGEATYQAIKAGYRLIDEACDYGNEKECGEGLKKALDEVRAGFWLLLPPSVLATKYNRVVHTCTMKHSPFHYGAWCG